MSLFKVKDPGTIRAEQELLNRRNIDTPSVEENIQGAIIQIRETMSGNSVGWSGNTVNFEGTWIIYLIQIESPYNKENAPAEIRLRNQSNAANTVILSGPVGPLRSLTWNGRLVLQGAWIIQGVRYNNGTPNQGSFNIIAEKLRD